LYHFLLIFPTGFKGVLTTYQIQFSSYFSHRVFGGDFLKMKMIIILKDKHIQGGVFIKMMYIHKDKHRLGGVLGNN
jgi:hypothetical protein